MLIGLSALQIALGTLDCSSGGSHGYGKQEHVPVEDTAWPPARRPDPIYAADCGEGMQTYPTEGMERHDAGRMLQYLLEQKADVALGS